MSRGKLGAMAFGPPLTEDVLLTPNGVDGVSGGYPEPPATVGQISAALQDKGPAAALIEGLDDLRGWFLRFVELAGLGGGGPFGLRGPARPGDLAAWGWGAVFAPGLDPAIREALSGLLELRRQQAARHSERRFRQLDYRPGESCREFLARYGAGYDLQPNRVPRYLLLVGDPASIPFSFQQQLDVRYSVGRLWLTKPGHYADYSASVLAAETSPAPRDLPPARAVFFGAAHPEDVVTQNSADFLVEPLAEKFRHRSGWRVDARIGHQATKARLSSCLGGGPAPDFLFSASHGLVFENGHPQQLGAQGAVLCSDWPGPAGETCSEDHYFAAADVPDHADLEGLICFLFSCYGAGTPLADGFAHRLHNRPPQIAPRAFVARLPQRLLARGALAVIAHVDRSWGYSFLWPRVGEQLQPFKAFLAHLLAGDPVGAAVAPFNTRYAHLSADLARELEDVLQGRRQVDDSELVRLWTATNDARGYIILGDPAVRSRRVQASGTGKRSA